MLLLINKLPDRLTHCQTDRSNDSSDSPQISSTTTQCGTYTNNVEDQETPNELLFMEADSLRCPFSLYEAMPGEEVHRKNGEARAIMCNLSASVQKSDMRRAQRPQRRAQHFHYDIYMKGNLRVYGSGSRAVIRSYRISSFRRSL